jgi:uncharacterized protein YfiM (DUF2279 family)
MKKVSILFFVSMIFVSSLQAKPILAKDHILHFSGSAFLTYWNYEFSSEIYNYSQRESLVYSVNLTFLLGVSKESSDKFIKKTKFSWQDLAANALGIASSAIIIHNTR